LRLIWKNFSIDETPKYAGLGLDLMIDDLMHSGSNIFLLSKSLVPGSMQNHYRVKIKFSIVRKSNIYRDK